jgi:hypothetical protein
MLGRVRLAAFGAVFRPVSEFFLIKWMFPQPWKNATDDMAAALAILILHPCVFCFSQEIGRRVHIVTILQMRSRARKEEVELLMGRTDLVMADDRTSC